MKLPFLGAFTQAKPMICMNYLKSSFQTIDFEQLIGHRDNDTYHGGV